MDFKTIVQTRHAAKQFDGKSIPQETMDELLEMIRFAPTSFNVQPWKVKIIEDKDLLASLKEASWNQPQITSCSSLLVFCANTNIDDLVTKLEGEMVSSGTPKEKVGAYVKIVRGFISGMDDQKKVHWTQLQTYIALSWAMNAAKSLGIDSCPMEGFIAQEYSKALNLPDSLVPTVLLPIGYATDTPYPKVRFSKEDLYF